MKKNTYICAKRENMIKYNLYENNLDKSWYDSSNVLYSECDDKDNELKTVRITFSNGRTYQYENVNVTDYLLFRNAPSQGTAFNKYMRKYDTQRIEDVNVESLNEELIRLTTPVEEEISTPNVTLNDYVIITDENNNVVMHEKITTEEKHLLEMVLTHLNVKYQI